MLIFGAVLLSQDGGPDAACGPELADLLEEIYVRVEEEAQTRGEVVHVEARFYTGIDVREAVGKGKSKLLGGRAPRFADMVARDRDGIPLRHVLCGVDEHVFEHTHRGPRREEPLLLGDVFLE